MCFYFVVAAVFVFETGPYCVAQAVLELKILVAQPPE
jgi:hypothetical protein